MSAWKRCRGPLASLALLAIGAGMAWMSWQRWPDTVIDYGREVYYPWQINEGRVLYRDLWHFFGPLSHYWNAFLFRVFGTHLLTLELFNLFLVALVAWLLFFLVREVADFGTAFVASATFLLVFAFSQYIECGNFNFICPYNHEIVHAAVLSFVALRAFRGWQKSRSAAWLWAVGLAAGGVSLAKVEILAALLAALAAGFVLQWRLEKTPPSRVLREAAILSAGFLLPWAGFLTYFCAKMPFRQALSALLYPYTVLFDTRIASEPYYKWVTGMDHPGENLLKLAQSLRWFALLWAGLYGLGWAFGRIEDPRQRNRAKAAAVVLAALAAIPLSQVSWWNQFRPLPVLAAAIVVRFCVDLVRRVRAGEEASLPVFRLALSVFALVLLWKMGLNAHLFHYGFVLALPATLLLEAELLHFVPLDLERRSGPAGWARAVGLFVIASGVFWYVRFCADIYKHRTFPLGSGPDRILEITPRPARQELILQKTLEKLQELMRPGQTLVSLPTGTLLNFWTRHANPTPYPDFSAMMMDTIGEDRMVEAFEAAPPDFIVLLDMDTSDGHGGPGSLGQDYGLKLVQWVLSRYRPVWQVRPPGNLGYGVIIFERR